jgi:hypothetical protein
LVERHRGSGWVLSFYLVLACTVVSVEPAHGNPNAAMTREVDFHISQGSLAHALLQFSAQAGVPISLDAGSAIHLNTPGLTGRQPAGTALQTLLRNSGLSYTIVGDTVTVIRIASAPKATGSDSMHAPDHHADNVGPEKQ